MLNGKLIASGLLLVSTVALHVNAFAQDKPAAKPAEKPTVPTLEEVLGVSGITLNGYIDASYSHLNTTGPFTSGVPSRVFDSQPNSFNLNQAAITIAKQPKEGFGGLVNLIVGSDANVIAPFPVNPGASSNFDVAQAYVQYATGPFTIIGGEYVTYAGAEVINPTSDVNFSRSILFGYAIPFTHTGVRATYAPSDTISLVAGVNNGWDDLRDTNSQKTLELGVSATPIKPLTITASDYIGEERVGGLTSTGPQGKRNIFDIVISYNLTDSLNFVLNYDNGFQDNFTSLVNGSIIKAKWQGVAGYVNYLITEQWRISVRGEWFNDEAGYRTGVIQKWKEATLTLAYLPAKSFEIRAEIRGDKSNKSSFSNSNGTTTNNQFSYALEALFKF